MKHRVCINGHKWDKMRGITKYSMPKNDRPYKCGMDNDGTVCV